MRIEFDEIERRGDVSRVAWTVTPGVELDLLEYRLVIPDGGALVDGVAEGVGARGRGEATRGEARVRRPSGVSFCSIELKVDGRFTGSDVGGVATDEVFTLRESVDVGAPAEPGVVMDGFGPTGDGLTLRVLRDVREVED